MQTWQHVFRTGFAPQLSTPALLAIKAGLEAQDPALIRGATTVPPPLECMQNEPLQAACPVAFGLWKGDGLTTVGQVEEAFRRLCLEADFALGEPSAVRWFLNWVDDCAAWELRRLLLPEVLAVLAQRQLPPVAVA
jgi:hypothetical protein